MQRYLYSIQRASYPIGRAWHSLERTARISFVDGYCSTLLLMGTQHCTGKAARVCRRQCSNSLPTNAATVSQQMQQPVYQQMHHVTRMHQTFHKVPGVTSACVNELGTLGKLYMEHRLQLYMEYRLQHPVYTLAFQKIKSASTCVCVACGAWCLVRTCGVCVCFCVRVCV